MKMFRKTLGLIAAMTLALSALAQSYPVNTPTYIPQAILTATTLTTAGTVSFQNNGTGTIYLRVLGTNTGLSATVQTTESRASSPTWNTLSVVNETTGARQASIVANGLYRVSVPGSAIVRFNLASVTGTNVIVTASGGNGVNDVVARPAVRNTYSITSGTTVASSATDFLSVTGSATKTVRISEARCTGTANSGGVTTINALKRITGYAAGVSTPNASLATVAFDTLSGSASASAQGFFANPSVGTLAGNLRAGTLQFADNKAVTAGGTVAAIPTVFEFGARNVEQQPTLRGTGEVFALNGNGATFPTGHAVQCSITWTED
jgi:hypothetical protein